jgi:DNA mismatch endonuclease (patch repair protein)
VTRKVIDGFTVETDDATAARLGRIRQRDTAPELVVRRVLHKLGVRFRTSNRDLPGSPDIANRSRRWAVFVHGCYWHRHAGCRRATTPTRNRDFWVAKFEANVARDARSVAALIRIGYRVALVWECETKSNSEALVVRMAELAISHICESSDDGTGTKD